MAQLVERSPRVSISRLTVNSEIFARILFLRIVLKGTFAMSKFATSE